MAEATVEAAMAAEDGGGGGIIRAAQAAKRAAVSVAGIYTSVVPPSLPPASLPFRVVLRIATCPFKMRDEGDALQYYYGACLAKKPHESEWVVRQQTSAAAAPNARSKTSLICTRLMPR